MPIPSCSRWSGRHAEGWEKDRIGLRQGHGAVAAPLHPPSPTQASASTVQHSGTTRDPSDQEVPEKIVQPVTPVVTVSLETVRIVRATHVTKTPDAIHLATARHAGASFFLTNDDRIPSLPGLEVVVLEELAAQQAARRTEG